jgi:NTP pyrophosphatase (non-canonical NTP hydrolase)
MKAEETEMTDYPCHSLPKDQWCDRHGRGGFMGHTCNLPAPIELTLEDKLILLIEECGEVIHAATKCLRFGWDRTQPGYGLNSAVLGSEVGDLLGVIDALPLNADDITKKRANKIAKATRVKRELAGPR